MEELSKEQEIIKILFREPYEFYNSRSISKKIGISHAGAFKILKKLEKRQIVISKKVGKANIYSLNLNDEIAKKQIDLILTIEARNYKKWIEEFSELKELPDFVIIYGSIIRNEKEAKDIDVLIVSDKSHLDKIKSIVGKKKRILIKPIHALHQTPDDFIKDLHSKNKTMLEILKTGIILYNPENLVNLMKRT